MLYDACLSPVRNPTRGDYLRFKDENTEAEDVKNDLPNRTEQDVVNLDLTAKACSLLPSTVQNKSRKSEWSHTQTLEERQWKKQPSVAEGRTSQWSSG